MHFINRSTVLLPAFGMGVALILLLSAIPNLACLLLVLFLFFCFSVINQHVRWLLALSLGLTWVCWSANSVLDSQIPKHWESKSVLVEGWVVGLPIYDDGQVRFRFRADQWLDNDKEQVINEIKAGLIQLSCYRCDLNIKASQMWRLTVRVKRPRGYASWGAFDYEKYLFRNRVIAKGYIRLKEDSQLLATTTSINSYREQIRNDLNTLLPSSSSGKGIMLALMIGDKSSLSQQSKQLFQYAGLSHLMAISGLHIGLIFIFAKALSDFVLRMFPRIFDIFARQVWVLFPALVTATCYAALAGFAVSTQRALIMLAVFVICRVTVRQINLLHVLLIAAVIVLLIDPLSILDPGFWLSFSAVAIIAISSNKAEVIKLWQLQPILWLGLMPLSVFFFGQVSLLSPAINLIAVPLFCLCLIPLVLLALVLSLLGLSMVSDALFNLLQKVFEFLYEALLWLDSKVISHWDIPELSLLHWLVYGLIVVAYLQSYRFKHYLWLGFIAALIFYKSESPLLQTGEFQIVLLDVGQGLSMVISTTNYNLVYDTGPRYGSGFTAAEAVLVPYLKHRRVNQLNQVIISHADNDHIGGYDYLASQFEIGSVLTSRPELLKNSELCQSGASWQIDDVSFDILSPESTTPKGSNNWSCVLKVSNDKFSVLITGDIEMPVENYLLSNHLNKLPADILLVPHQGSKTSSSVGFLDAVAPSYGLIAAGYGNHYGHPHAEVVHRYQQRSIRLFSTIESGSILLKAGKFDVDIQSYRQSQKRFWME